MLYKKSVSFTFCCCLCKGISLLNISNLLHFQLYTVYFRSSTLLNYHHFACCRPEFEIAHLVYLLLMTFNAMSWLLITCKKDSHKTHHNITYAFHNWKSIVNSSQYKNYLRQEWHTVYVRRHVDLSEPNVRTWTRNFTIRDHHFQFVRSVRSVRIDEFFRASLSPELTL